MRAALVTLKTLAGHLMRGLGLSVPGVCVRSSKRRLQKPRRSAEVDGWPSSGLCSLALMVPFMSSSF